MRLYARLKTIATRAGPAVPILYRIAVNVLNPTSKGGRFAAVKRTIAFDVRTRLLRRPTVAPIGHHSKLIAYPGESNSPHAAYRNPPNWPEMGVWQNHLKPGDLFIDVGANVGIYTLIALDVGARVIALEPDSRNAARLQEHLDMNGYEAEIIRKAAAAHIGEITFTVGLDSFNHVVLGDVDALTHTVPTTTLDEVIGDRQVAGVKIDVEGAERLVMQGAERALRDQRIALIQLEWTANEPVRILGETRDPVAIMLRSAGYTIYRPDRHTAQLNPVHGTVPPGKDVFAAPSAGPSI